MVREWLGTDQATDKPLPEPMSIKYNDTYMCHQASFALNITKCGNTLRPNKDGRRFPDDTFERINAFFLKKML